MLNDGPRAVGALNTTVKQFIQTFRESIREGIFVKLTLANYKGSESGLQKVFARLIETRRGLLVSFQFRREHRDTFKNLALVESAELLETLLTTGFRNAHLFTLRANYQLDLGKRSARLNVGRPTITNLPSRRHNKQTKTLVNPDSYFLKALGVTTDRGEIRSEQRHKWKQINKFVEVLATLFSKSALPESNGLRVADLGSGKGYLTFAAYQYLINAINDRGLSEEQRIEFTAVDSRGDLIALCNGIADASEFQGLKFLNCSIEQFFRQNGNKDLDIVIALHACDTATDDAIFAAIAANARIILVAPCCHRELRPKISAPGPLGDILKFPLLLERAAESLTDGVRAIVLEAYGYEVRMLEFVETEHTPKNNLISAVRKTRITVDKQKLDCARQILKAFGIGNQRLLSLIELIK
ncbi:MAG: hypothetical protein C4324_03060 [Blastocatellia bacterium]